MSEDKSDKGPIADTPQLPRPVALPLLVLLLLTVVTQLGSLPYIMGRAKNPYVSNEEDEGQAPLDP